jgi:serine/threonine protein phosphatase 1
MRLFAIPDVHGRNDLLQELLRHLKEDKGLDLTKDKLIFLGDMIDRGDDSKGVVTTIKDLCEKHPENVIALRGNHEDMGIDACVTDSFSDKHLWIMNGGNETFKSYGHTQCYMDPEHIKWMEALPLFHLEEGFFFSHAPVRKNYDGDFTDLSTWTYLDFVDEEQEAKDFGTRVGVCGHIHRLREGFQTKPRMYKHYIYTDSGCGCSPKAPLTCVEVISREVITIWPPEAMETHS